VRKSLLLVPLFAVLVSACGGSSPTSPTSLSSISITVPGTGVTTYTYTANVAPILNSDCVACHNSSQHDAGVNLTTYAGVMQVVTAGSDSSTLVRVTQPQGPMYGNLSGNRNQKVQIIYDWVVSSHAAQ
jgi:Planctomycete cytochrome C